MSARSLPEGQYYAYAFGKLIARVSCLEYSEIGFRPANEMKAMGGNR
jgi:hypothetical protein